jgi:hypothetical protein
MTNTILWDVYGKAIAVWYDGEKYYISVSDSDKADITTNLQASLDTIEEEVKEVEEHIHTRERWFGKSADQSGNDWALDGLTPYQAISGNNAYGSDADDEAKVLGTDDTPVITGMTVFDLHRVLVVHVSQDSVYKMRFVYGTGTMAAAISAGQTSEIMVKFDAANPQQSAGIPFEVKMPRLAVDTKVWCQAWNATDDATVDFFIGLHEYVS